MARNITAVLTRTNDSSKVDLYTVPAKNTAVISMIYILATAGNESATLCWYDSHTATEYTIAVGNALSGSSGEYLLLNDIKIVLKENDILRVQNSGTNSTINYLVSMELRAAEAIQFHS